MYPYIYIFDRQIGTYGLCMMLGFWLAGLLALHRGKPLGLKMEDLVIVAAMAFGGTLIGGGLLYVFVTYPIDQIIEFIRQGDFRFLASGLVFYGGLVGGGLGALLGAKVSKCSLSILERSVVPFIPLGHAVGRIGCVMAGCCHGFEYEGPLALYYPHSLTGLSPDKGYFPVQPLESVLNVGICLLLLWYAKRIKRTFELLFLYLGLYSVSRFFLEMLRGDSVRGVWSGFSTSQYIGIALLVVSVLGVVWCRKTPSKSENAA